MRAKFINENMNESSPYGYYDMANALDVMKTVVPALRKNKIHFEYDAYSNFLKVKTENEEQAKLAENIILEIGEGDKSDIEDENDSAIIILI